MRIVLFVFVVLLILGLGRGLLPWFHNQWDGKSQITLAIETREKDILILAVTPAKSVVALVLVPSDLEIETPWFGKYQAGKLSLLAEQEESINIFIHSLSYFLKLPIDRGIVANNDLVVNSEWRGSIKTQLQKFFFPPLSIDYWRLWRFLKNRELVWQMTDLSIFAEKKTLPDGSQLLVIDPGRVEEEIGGFFTDPLVKNEDLAVSIFNTGDITGLAQRMGEIINNMGGRVVEVGDKDFEGSHYCLLFIRRSELMKTVTVRRLEKNFGCEIKLADQVRGDIQLFVGDVKIR